jgi:hypothetical protein
MSLSRPSHSRVALLLAAAVLAAGCSDSATAPTNQPAELGALLNEMSASGMSVAAGASLPPASAVVTARPGIVPNACPYDNATQRFVCPTVTVNGLTFTRSFQLLDVAGEPHSKFEAAVVAIRTFSTVRGTLTNTTAGGSTSVHAIDRQEVMTLSGIRTDRHTLNGVATSLVEGTITTARGTVHTKTTQTETTTNLVLPNPRTGSRWPIGSVTVESTSEVTANGEDKVTSHMTATITFDGTKRAKITVSTGFGTFSCTIDLENPAASAQACVA